MASTLKNRTVDGDVTGVGQGEQPSPELIGKLSAMRDRVQQSVGRAVVAMMALPRYKAQSLGDLGHLLIEPLLRDRIAEVTAKRTDGTESDAVTAGFAIWASVSDEIDMKIQEQCKAGAFPIRLAPDDWTSGDKIWLLDIIAPSQQLSTAVLVGFKDIAKGKPVSTHPIVRRSVDPEVLKKLELVRA